MHDPWGPYPETVLQFPEADLTVDLRQPITDHTCGVLRGLGLRGPFAVVTACNPMGQVYGAHANRRLSAVLASVVRWHHPEAIPAHGGAPGGPHLEPGWAVPGPLEEACRLAARFFQNAVFWFDGTRFSIVPVLASGPVLVLPRSPIDR